MKNKMLTLVAAGIVSATSYFSQTVFVPGDKALCVLENFEYKNCIHEAGGSIFTLDDNLKTLTQKGDVDMMWTLELADQTDTYISFSAFGDDLYEYVFLIDLSNKQLKFIVEDGDGENYLFIYDIISKK
jgi:hypothetical protein